MGVSAGIRQIAGVAIAATIVAIGMVVGAIAFAPATSAQETQSGQAAVVNVDSLTFRQAPGLDGAVIAWLPYGTDLTVIYEPVTVDGYEWFQLEQDGTTGWAVEGFRLTDPGTDSVSSPSTDSVSSPGTGGESTATAPVPEVPAAQTIWTVTAGFLEIRTDPSPASGVARIATYGTRLTQTGDQVEINGRIWYPVEDGGWIGGQRDGESSGIFPEQYPRYVTADVLNVRSSAGLSGTVLLTLDKGDAVNVFDSSRDADGINWFAVNEDGTLWVAAEYLTISPPDGP